MSLACFVVSSAAAQQTLPSGVEATTVFAAAPGAVAYDAAGNLYLALKNDHVVRKVDAFGLITTVAGTGQQGFAGDGAAASSALLDSPTGIAVGTDGTLYIADSRNHRIRSVANGIITTVAGTGTSGFSGDGSAATGAQLDLPSAISLDAAGNLFIADTNNHRIRKVAGGLISTVAGTGEQGFGGDGSAAVNALLDTPTGVAADLSGTGSIYIADTRNQRVRRLDSSGIMSTVAGAGSSSPQASVNLLNPAGLSVDLRGTLYIADSGNHVIRSLSGGTVSTVAGTGEQGFAGDLGSAKAAVLDTPRAVGAGPDGLLAFADSRNQRVRSITSGIVTTVAGAPPPLTEGILLSGPAAGAYGASGNRLTATFASPLGAATGALVLNVGGQPVLTAPIVGNTASFDLGFLAGGLQVLAVSYAGNTTHAATVSGVYLVNVSAAPQTINFPRLQTPVVFTSGATAPLLATASSGLPVTYTITGPGTVTGSTLTYTGSGVVTVTATQAGNGNYAAASSSQTIQVSPSPLAASSVSPNAVTLSSAGSPITVNGSGFTQTSVIRLNGVVLPTSGQSTTQLRATLPAILSTAALSVTVFDPASGLESAPLLISVTAPAAAATLAPLPTATSQQQPSLKLTLQTPYPVDLAGTYTLSFKPLSGVNIDDTSIMFSNGSRTYPFVVTAGTTAPLPVAFQTGTLAGTVNISLSLTAGGVDVTPAAARTTTVVIPAQVPAATSVSFTQTGTTLIVTVVGYTNTREASQATFNFIPAPGTSLAVTSLTQDVTSIFSRWFQDPGSSTLGSIFTYTQPFTLSDADAKVQGVTVTLTNTVGNSTATTTP
ncbi:MAG: hypothetical protein ACRYGF_15645 [Janthinobacterium lividum]